MLATLIMIERQNDFPTSGIFPWPNGSMALAYRRLLQERFRVISHKILKFLESQSLDSENGIFLGFHDPQIDSVPTGGQLRPIIASKERNYEDKASVSLNLA